MMFLVHIAFSLIVAVFIAGCAFIAWSKRDIAAKTLLKVAGYIAIILSLSNALCLGYYAVRYWEDGYFKAPMKNHGCGMGMMGGAEAEMMDDSGMHKTACPMKKDMMKGGMMHDKAPSAPNTLAPETSGPTDAHEARH